jgi:predicted DCC family thiol-disulfide oxidoreductase YuxK
MKSHFVFTFGSDLRSMAALRVGCALIVLLDLAQRASDLVAHYTDQGIVPRMLVIDHSNRWAVSLHQMSGIWEWQAVLFAVAALAALALLVGYRTRLASILTWGLCVSLVTRNPYVGYSADVLLRLMLFWGMFLPWGAVYSVDAASRDDAPPAQQFISLGTIAFVIQIVSVYLFSVVWKSGKEWWSEGSAIYYALSIDYLATPIGKALREAPYPVLRILNWSVLILEFIAPVALLVPVKKTWFRIAAILGIVILHLSISSVLFVGIFPLLGITGMFFFLPGQFWDFLARKCTAAAGAGIRVYYDDDCGFCSRTVRLIKMFFFLPAIESASAQSVPEIEAEMRQRNSWVVLDREGDHHYGYDGVVTVLGGSPLLWPLVPLLRLTPVRWCGEKVYRIIATHRRISCELPPRHAAVAALKPRYRLLFDASLALLIGYVFVLNLSTIKRFGVRLPSPWNDVGVSAGLDQSWSMFAPFPAKDDGWYVIPGKLRNGASIDLFRAGRPVSFSKPTYGSLEFKNHRWVKFHENLRSRAFLLPGYSRHLCREWNRRHRSGERLDELEIIYVLERTQPAPEYSPIEKQSKYKFKCDS